MSIIPARTAYTVILPIDLVFSLRQTLLRWKITVGSDILSVVAISLLMSPLIISFNTSFSRADSLSVRLSVLSGMAGHSPYRPVV